VTVAPHVDGWTDTEKQPQSLARR